MLARHKTDMVDSLIIAKYAKLHQVHLYKPRDCKEQELKHLYRSLQKLKDMKFQAENHLECKESIPQSVLKIWINTVKLLNRQIEKAEQEISNLIADNGKIRNHYQNLQIITGIGHTTAIAILAEIPNILDFRNARQLAAYAGITPKHRISGSSVIGKPRISKIGSSNLRKALYFPAIVAKNHNPIIKAFCANLIKKGKHNKAIVCAAMRKLIHIIFAVLKNNTVFNPNLDHNY